jgi:hypothetical protein
MLEHISYAMRNAEATHALVWLNPPSALRDWSYLAIEFIIVSGAILAIVHAVRHSRQHGNPSALLTLAACFTYGLLIDIASYYTVENFWHGEFSVMFLYNRLPLYIALFYPAFLYHAYMTLRRCGFSVLVEGVSVAFYGGLTYLIFDNLGPMLGWWIWDRADPTTLPYLNSVPVTSYHWFFLFTGTFAVLARVVCWDWVAAGKGRGTIAAGFLALPFATCAIGALLFVPYNLFAYNGMLELAAALHATVFALAGLVFVLHYQCPQARRDTLLMLFPLTYLVGHTYLYVAKFGLFFGVGADGLTREGLAAGNLPAACIAIVGSAAILFAAQRSAAK